jgi:hypothetical protein
MSGSGIECIGMYRITQDLNVSILSLMNAIFLLVQAIPWRYVFTWCREMGEGPAVTLPPGELMYMDIGFSGLSASRKSN